jgi:general secretion pathway protein D
MHRLTLATLAACLLATSTSLAQDSVATETTEEGHLLNLRNADIQTLVSTVAEMTGQNVVVDSRVSGEVTVISHQPLDDEALFDLFLAVLEVNDFGVAETDNVLKVMPLARARQQGGGVGSASDATPETTVTEIIPVEHVAAEELVGILRPLMAQSGSQLAHHAGSNSLIITERAGNIRRLREIIQRIDRSSDDPIEVLRLEHASASELVRTLSGLVSDAQGGLRLVADERTNTLMLSGDSSERLRLRTLITHLDTPLESAEATRVIYLRYADADGLVPILEQVARNARGPAGEGEAELTNISAHTETNALIVNAPPRVFDAVREVARQLDVRRKQIHVEAVIAEVSSDFAREFGVQWQTAFSTDADGNINSGSFGGTNFGEGGRNILGAAVNPLSIGGGLNIGYVEGSVSLPGSDTEVLQLGWLLRALANDGSSNVLSTPSIVTLDNAEANISVGAEVPFLTGQFTGTENGQGFSNPFQTIRREEVGLKLTVTPQITDGDTVLLKIEQEVSSLAGTISGAADLVTNKRTLNTTVMVRDGAMLVLGGLIDEDLETNEEKVPLLGDIPLLGRAFRYDRTSKTKRNLMVFLRPTILHDESVESRLTNGKYNYIRGVQEAQSEEQTWPARGIDVPLLPEMLPEGPND